MPGSPELGRSASTFWRTIMYAITGITGKVGGALARSLLAERLPVRAVARDEGALHSFLQPADKPLPMVATQDVGRLAAVLLREDWSGTRVVELEGARRVSPNDLARAFATVLKHPVWVETVPRESWEQIF